METQYEVNLESLGARRDAADNLGLKVEWFEHENPSVPGGTEYELIIHWNGFSEEHSTQYLIEDAWYADNFYVEDSYRIAEKEWAQ